MKKCIFLEEVCMNEGMEEIKEQDTTACSGTSTEIAWVNSRNSR